MRAWCALTEMSTEDWICHMHMQGCNQNDILNEFLKQEADLTETSIKEIATK